MKLPYQFRAVTGDIMDFDTPIEIHTKRLNELVKSFISQKVDSIEISWSSGDMGKFFLVKVEKEVEHESELKSPYPLIVDGKEFDPVTTLPK